MPTIPHGSPKADHSPAATQLYPALMNDFDPDRYGGPNVALKVMGALIAVALFVLGAIWTFADAGAPQPLGPIVAGLGVALFYVSVIQKRH